MNLHEWITRQVDAVEDAARNHQQPSPDWEYDECAREVRDLFNSGTVAFIPRHGTGQHIALNDPQAVLRRCEADRRILERHRIDPARVDDWLEAVACRGCGWTGDCDDPVTDNINDCPELLDLAYAHGITDEILDSLDRPQPPPRKPHSGSLTKAFWDALAPRTPMADVPAALRGPHWKP